MVDIATYFIKRIASLYIFSLKLVHKVRSPLWMPYGAWGWFNVTFQPSVRTIFFHSGVYPKFIQSLSPVCSYLLSCRGRTAPLTRNRGRATPLAYNRGLFHYLAAYQYLFPVMKALGPCFLIFRRFFKCALP